MNSKTVDLLPKQPPNLKKKPADEELMENDVHEKTTDDEVDL